MFFFITIFHFSAEIVTHQYLMAIWWRYRMLNYGTESYQKKPANASFFYLIVAITPIAFK